MNGGDDTQFCANIDARTEWSLPLKHLTAIQINYTVFWPLVDMTLYDTDQAEILFI